jgi:hypothetical protein
MKEGTSTGPLFCYARIPARLHRLESVAEATTSLARAYISFRKCLDSTSTGAPVIFRASQGSIVQSRLHDARAVSLNVYRVTPLRCEPL